MSAGRRIHTDSLFNISKYDIVPYILDQKPYQRYLKTLVLVLVLVLVLISVDTR